jgi:hypothetical protein
LIVVWFVFSSLFTSLEGNLEVHIIFLSISLL